VVRYLRTVIVTVCRAPPIGYSVRETHDPKAAVKTATAVPFDTMTDLKAGRPTVDRRGVEPRSPGCKPGVVPLDQQPLSSRSIDPRGPPESRTRSPSLPRRHAAGAPADHRPILSSNQSSRRESNPRFLFVREVSSPLDHGTSHQSPRSSSTGGSRTHRHQTLDLTAMPVRVPCRRTASLRTRRVAGPGVEPRPPNS
jgi:hypothetical protein